MTHRCNTLHTKQELAAGAAAQSKTRWRAPQGDAELMTENKFSALSRHRDLNKSTTNILNECGIANIDANDAMILSHDANPGRIEFRKGHREF